MFCDKCGTLLDRKVEEDGTSTVFCPTCGWTADPKNQNLVVKSEIPHDFQKEATIQIDEEVQKEQQQAVTAQECPKCKNNKAYYWQLQTRRSDEGATTFYRCTECSHTWREY